MTRLTRTGQRRSGNSFVSAVHEQNFVPRRPLEIMNFNKKDWITLGTLVLIAVFLFVGGHSLADGKLHVYFLDVGQGDAIFIQTPSGRQILIDGGPDNTVLQRLGEVMPFYDRSIDLVVLTHPDADHLAGLNEVLERYEVVEIMETGMACATSLCLEWEENKERQGGKIQTAFFGQEVETGDGARFLVLHPFEEVKDKKFSSTNNSGVVLKLIFGQQSILLTGDIEKQTESKLVAAGVDIDSDFLKVAHHGSKTSTTEDFLQAVSPLGAFIEVGAHNRYGHPTEEVLSRLESFGIKYYRTDTDGTIELVLDGENYLIK